MLCVSILKFFYAECHVSYYYADFQYEKYHYAECHVFKKNIKLSVSVLKVLNTECHVFKYNLSVY